MDEDYLKKEEDIIIDDPITFNIGNKKYLRYSYTEIILNEIKFLYTSFIDEECKGVVNDEECIRLEKLYQRRIKLKMLDES